MSYTKPYIPRADGKFRTWVEQFCRNIHKDPARYMMTPAETASLMQALNRFLEALSIATSQRTRNSGTIAAKQDARSILQNLIQKYAAFIRANGGIDDDDKIRIGVRPRNIAHNRRQCPNTPPLLNYILTLPGVDLLTFKADETSKAKPYGAERLELWVAYSKPGEPPPKPSQATFVGSFKKSKMLVDLDVQRDTRMEGDGKPTYWARWAGYDGNVGPWSLACRPSLKKKQEPKKKPECTSKDGATEAQSLRMAA